MKNELWDQYLNDIANHGYEFAIQNVVSKIEVTVRKMVYSAKRPKWLWQQNEELIVDALTAISKSVVKYSPNRGAALTTYLIAIAKNAVKRSLRRIVASAQMVPVESGDLSKANVETGVFLEELPSDLVLDRTARSPLHLADAIDMIQDEPLGKQAFLVKHHSMIEYGHCPQGTKWPYIARKLKRSEDDCRKAYERFKSKLEKILVDAGSLSATDSPAD